MTTTIKATVFDVPQTTWHSVETLLLALNIKDLTKEEACKSLGNVTQREVMYVVQALRFLGWIDGARRAINWPLSLNSTGKVAATNKVKRHEDAWDMISNWGPIYNLINQNDTGALQDLINEGLCETTALRRLSTAKNWLKDLDPNKGSASQTTTVQQNKANYIAAQKRYETDIEIVATKLPTCAQQLFEGTMEVDKLPEGTDVKVLAKVRKHHGKFVKALKKIWKNICAVSGSTILLRASHIKPWAVSSGAEKTDPENGLLLESRWDALFDDGLVSFDDNGQVMLSTTIETTEWKKLNITNMDKIQQTLSDKTKEYLEYHRTHVFKKA